MRRKIVLGVVAFLLVLQAQMVFAQNYENEFRQELGRNNLRNIERLLQKRANQMDLVRCMVSTISPSPDIYNELRGYNINNALEVVRLLVKYGLDVNSPWRLSDYSILSYTLELAVREQRSYQIIQFLLDSGANPNLASGVSRLPLRVAYRNKDMPLVNLLLDRGANGAELLIELGSSGDNETIKRLISRGVQIRSEQGAIALRFAALKGHFDTVKLLVENGVNINARENDGYENIQKGATAASVAYDQGEMDIYDYLKANGARDFEPRQVTQQPASPAPSSSTTNVYVQPSAPAQSSSSSSSTPSRNVGKEIADAFKPPLQSGTYSLSGTQEKISIAGIAKSGIITQTWQGKSYQGTYNIDGNRMTVQIRGYTFVFNITSETSFSGHNETWVRTGF